MSPPNVPGYPGHKLPKAKQEVVARPKQNSHGDSDPPLVEPDKPRDRPPSVRHETVVDALAEELVERNRELAEAKAELASREPIAATGPTEKQLRKAQLHSAIVKTVLAMAGALGAVTTYLSVHSATVLPPRVESTEVRTKVVEDAAGTDHAALLAIKEYLRAEQARRECLDSQMASALVRGTGHRLSGPSDSVSWIESSMPTRRPVMLWDRAVWYPSTPCAATAHLP